MKTAFMMITAIVTTMAGVGGIEHSTTDAELASGVIVALVGLGIMYCTVLMIKREQA